MKVVIVVQARMTSTRLPGKVLLPLAGRPMLQCLLERLQRVELAQALVVATTTNATDDPIAQLCGVLGVACYRGSELDVLSRYAEAAAVHGADVVVRITSDCPLMDPALVDKVIGVYLAGDCDYASNMIELSYPYGMAVEVFSAAALASAHAQAQLPAEREHVTPYIYWHADRFKLKSVRNELDLSHHRWTVDTQQDYQLVQLIYETLYPENPQFESAHVLALLALHPQWMCINQHIEQIKLTPPAKDSQ
jgi:spore coat polysaccharide biosynthesis protein SpsF